MGNFMAGVRVGGLERRVKVEEQRVACPASSGGPLSGRGLDVDARGTRGTVAKQCRRHPPFFCGKSLSSTGLQAEIRRPPFLLRPRLVALRSLRSRPWVVPLTKCVLARRCLPAFLTRLQRSR